MSYENSLSKESSSEEIGNLSNSETLNSDLSKSIEETEKIIEIQKQPFTASVLKEMSQISMCSDESNILFLYDDFKVYDGPVDSHEFEPSEIETSKLAQEIKKLKGKYEDFKKTTKRIIPKTVAKPKPKKAPVVKTSLTPKPKKSSQDTITSSNSSKSSQKTVNKVSLISLEIDIGSGYTVTEDVHSGDSSYDIAARAFKQKNIKANYKSIRELGDLIQQEINNYLGVVAKELKNYEKKVKKCEEENYKKQLEKIKPPLLQTEKLAETRKKVIGSLQISTGEDKEETITIREGDIPEELAKEFSETHNLCDEACESIAISIKELIEQTLHPSIKINFEIDEGKTAAIEVSKGDDLFSLAHRFVRDNRIGSKYTSKVYNMLRRTLSENQA
ncbi:unnamed protein product [Blepharisma stoltei]|uniref:Uncharacterized protein n=1 Tax=Blepharisma stoltei TaxID=1481888 RepID=A0AAU9JMZ0_9CILI|nr:unnamed protein product [Blepharisma stoltei]